MPMDIPPGPADTEESTIAASVWNRMWNDWRLIVAVILFFAGGVLILLSISAETKTLEVLRPILPWYFVPIGVTTCLGAIALWHFTVGDDV